MNICGRTENKINEIMDLVKRDDETASLRGLLQEVNRLAPLCEADGRTRNTGGEERERDRNGRKRKLVGSGGVFFFFR